MRTPICDFVKKYAEGGMLRMHMPGHKGVGGELEKLDITEIRGADSLYDADGIIKESEENASRIFGCSTYYSTEGSSQCIRAMVYLVCAYAREQGRRPKLLAARNAHRSFLSAVALSDAEVEWLFPSEGDSYLSCRISAGDLEKKLNEAEELPAALYVTSPDYLGSISDIGALSEVCRKYGLLLIVDNAHGAYLRFLETSDHPMDHGADMCCDSAHKTLPVLTGGAYLHMSDRLPGWLCGRVKDAMALFGSTSPSYLVLRSLDMANPILSSELPRTLAKFIPKVDRLRSRLSEKGYVFFGDEPIKLTIDAGAYGYKGTEIAEYLRTCNIECEFSERDFTVLMLTPYTGDDGLAALEAALMSLDQRDPICTQAPSITHPKRVCSVREAVMSFSETVDVKDSVGRVLADVTVACPPAVPIVVSGELIDESAVKCFEYYGIKTCRVIK